MQIAYSFDKTTLIKIGKGALIAVTGGAALALLDYVGTLQINNPLVATLVVTLVPIAVNAVREWIKGTKQ